MKVFWRVLLVLFGVALVAIAAFVATLVRGFRTQDPRILEPMRRFLNETVNPETLKTAGKKGEETSVIHHVGRSTGTEYSTPIGAKPTAGGFVVALPYGSGAQWVRNVVAAGSAVLEHDGETHVVHDPAIVPIEDTVFATDEPWILGVFGVREALVLRT
ncbi:hypothetical protein ARHIZOSPH14_07480 [Agromyces rhizosphaerae]|uniref:Nitroreductase family deazaflavin-dependent oxidoreductase n=1 Tax=Agromyces rhizosphaerae TaxID=88374 RepID=A0A9W6FNH2_9MICO|nr:hypothetical protein [Agromyces rhizosphaerae]GLI26506.1 hypothetical protein ARHIZOSPH14_07480 [Agromyces rhizosphaerae]